MASDPTPTFARLTPAGRAALAVVALRGPLPPSPLRTPAGRPLPWPAPGIVRAAQLVDEGRPLDAVVARGVPDGVELCVHGGEGVIAALGHALARLGARPVEAPGAGAPTSLRHARALASARWGALAALARDLDDALRQGALPAGLRARLVAAAARVPLGRRLARPPVVRLVGRPNAGKSTLFNALLADDRALVSPRPGTTRDTVRAELLLRGARVRLEDSAGRDDAMRDVDGADLLVHLLAPDETVGPATVDEARGVPVERVVGKADLLGAAERGRGPPRVSGLRGDGVEALLARLAWRLGLGGDARDDVLAPLDDEFGQRLERGLALPDRP